MSIYTPLLSAILLIIISSFQVVKAQESCAPISWDTDQDRRVMQGSSFSQATTFIDNAPQINIQGVIVIQEGRAVYETYPNKYATDTLHDIRSATKSIVGLLVGIAIDQGKLRLDDTLLSFFPEYTSGKEIDERKKRITIDHLLTMASGLDANSEDSNSPGNEDHLYEAEDWLQFSLDIPMAAEPGSQWAYASMNSFLLGVVVGRATGQEFEDFAQTYLFDPLGIKDSRWTYTPKGYVVAQGNFYIAARDMARIGQLVLNNGCWDGQQVISKEWIQASFAPRFPTNWPNYDTYGYQWYKHTMSLNGQDYPYVFASGNGGQKLYIVPDKDLVVVTFTTAYNTGYGQRRSLEIFRQVLMALDNE